MSSATAFLRASALALAMAAPVPATSILMVNVSETVPHVQSGRLRALAVTSIERLAALTDTPTVAESGYPGFEALMWYGVVVRSAAPKGAIDRLSGELARSLQLADVREAFARLGLATASMGPAEFDAFLRAEIQNNGKIIRALGLKAE